MNRLIPAGVGIAAVVAVLLVGSQLFGSPTGPGGPSATPEPSAVPSPLPSAWVGILQGPFVVSEEQDPVEVTVNIAAPGWIKLPGLGAVSKDDDGLDAPQTVGVALLAWAWPAGTGFLVYGDPCQWSTTTPETPATTPAEIAAALAAQASRAATAIEDVTVGGYAGKAISLSVPLSYEVPGATRDEEFAACDQATFAMYGVEGDTGPARFNGGPGEIDDLVILDVNGSIVIIDMLRGPAAQTELVDEMRGLAESATFVSR